MAMAHTPCSVSELSTPMVGCPNSPLVTPADGPVVRSTGSITTKCPLWVFLPSLVSAISNGMFTAPETSPWRNHSFSKTSEESSDLDKTPQDLSYSDNHTFTRTPVDPEIGSHGPNKSLPPSNRSSIIHQLLRNPALYDPLRTPRFPIVLCHGVPHPPNFIVVILNVLFEGLYGFDVRGPSSFPSLRIHYWSSVLGILRKTVRADVIVTSVPR
jgi:triacylglycerol lipase